MEIILNGRFSGTNDNLCHKMNSVNPLDRKLATALKAALKKNKADTGEKQSGDFHQALQRVTSEDLRRTLETLFSKVVCQTTETNALEAKEASRILRTVLARGFSETPSVAFLAWLDSFEGLTLHEILPVTPNAICLSRWLKKTKASAQEIQKQLAEQPDWAYSTAGADWLLERPKVEMSFPVVEKFLSRQARPEYLPAWSDGLVAAIKNDKRGDLLAVILRHPLTSQDQIRVLSEVVRSNHPLFKAVVDLLPVILLRKDSSRAVVGFVHSLFDGVLSSDGNEREFMTAILARLATGILIADRRTANSDEVLALVCKIARQLRNVTGDETVKKKTWVFENVCLEDSPSGGKLCVNLQGARYIARAFENANQGFPVKEILSVTARYLGLSQIGKNGEVVAYDPLQHEDVVSGLLPGESVVILESGWAFQDEAVMRAKVKKTTGGNNV